LTGATRVDFWAKCADLLGFLRILVMMARNEMAAVVAPLAFTGMDVSREGR